jgi:hypothetical protein
LGSVLVGVREMEDKLEDAIGSLASMEGGKKTRKIVMILDGMDFMMAALGEGAAEMMEMVGRIREVGCCCFLFFMTWFLVTFASLLSINFICLSFFFKEVLHHENLIKATRGKNEERGWSTLRGYKSDNQLLFPASPFHNSHDLGRRPAAAFSKFSVGDQSRGFRSRTCTSSSTCHQPQRARDWRGEGCQWGVEGG